MTRSIGLDLSLTSTGVVVLQDEVVMHAEVIPTSPKDGSDMRRFDITATRIVDIYETYSPDVVVFENYAFSHRNTRLAEQGGIVKRELWRAGARPEDWHLITPSANKKYATGYGNASKEEMIVAAATYFVGWPSEIRESNDAADALHLARQGVQLFTDSWDPAEE